MLLGIDIDCLGGRVYWSDITGQSIKSSKYDGTDVQNFLTSGMKQTITFRPIHFIVGLRFIQYFKKIFNCLPQHDAPTQSYTSFNLLDIGSPEGISIDWVSRNIYWTDSTKDTLEVANLDNKLRKVIISEGLVNPRGVAVHPTRG